VRLRVIPQQVIEPIDLATGIRQLPAASHHAVKRAVVLLAERSQQSDDHVPGVCFPRDNDVPADLGMDSALTAGVQNRVGATDFHHWLEHPGIEDADLRRESRDDERLVHLRDAVGGDLRAGVDEHLEPLAETRRVELLVRAGAIGLPQVEVEDGRQLCGRRERQQLAAVLQPEVRDRQLQDFRRQERHRQRQLWIGSNSGEDVGAGAVLWHGPAIIPAVSCKKQS
jgi:hypothetical protein